MPAVGIWSETPKTRVRLPLSIFALCTLDLAKTFSSGATARTPHCRVIVGGSNGGRTVAPSRVADGSGRALARCRTRRIGSPLAQPTGHRGRWPVEAGEERQGYEGARQGDQAGTSRLGGGQPVLASARDPQAQRRPDGAPRELRARRDRLA